MSKFRKTKNDRESKPGETRDKPRVRARISNRPLDPHSLHGGQPRRRPKAVDGGPTPSPGAPLGDEGEAPARQRSGAKALAKSDGSWSGWLGVTLFVTAIGVWYFLILYEMAIA